MFDLVTIGASDLEASRRFYATVLGALGRRPTAEEPARVAWHASRSSRPATGAR